MTFGWIGCAALLSLAANQAAVYEESGGRVVIEAEHFDSRTVDESNDSHWHIVPDEDFQFDPPHNGDIGDPVYTDARNDAYVQVLPDITANHNNFAETTEAPPYLDYKVYITTPGTYQLWIRWRGHSGTADSMFGFVVGLGDGQPGGVPDYYRYAQGSGASFQGGWQGVGGPELHTASGDNVDATWEIPEPGIYTIRLTHREDGVGIDALSFQLTSVAAPSDPGPPESPISTDFPPFASGISFDRTDAGITPDTSFTVTLEDGGSSDVDPSSVSAALDGQPLEASASRSGAITTVAADSPGILESGSDHVFSVTFSDDGSPANTITRDFEFTVEPYATLGADLAQDSVDTGTSGFNIFIHQAEPTGGNLPNSTQRAEAQLRGLLINPETGQPYENVVSGGPEFTEEGIINWNQDAPAGIGNFDFDSGHEDQPIPGIPGTTGSTDNIAGEIITYLDLPAGVNRLGVNSDDGFRLTSSDNPKDAFAQQLGVFDGGRGAADSTFSVRVEQAGIYPVRLIWYEGGGGANLEFFSIAENGEKIPINDRQNSNVIRAYRVSSASALPIARSVLPLPGAVNVSASSSIIVELQDQDTDVDESSIAMTVNGAPVTPEISSSGDITTVAYAPPEFLVSGSKQEISLAFSDSASPAHSFARSWSFTVEDWADFPVVPAAFALPAGSASTPGFNVRLHQMIDARPGGNNLPAPLIQLEDGFIDPTTGQPYSNEIDTQFYFEEFGKWDGFTFQEDGVINYNQDARDDANAGAGNFQPDAPIPGIPGLGFSTDNIAMETTTFLELDRGVYRMGVNSDDGFVVSAAPSPQDAFPLRLGLFDGGRGAADTLFDFVVEKAGVYPFILHWWEGDGGANVEWFHIDAETGQRILINDPDNPNAISAFRDANVNKPFIKSVSPLLGALGVETDAPIEVVIGQNPQLDSNSIQMSVNGAAVAPDISSSGSDTTVRYVAPGGLPSGENVQVSLTYSDTSTPPAARTIRLSFTTPRDPIGLPPIDQSEDGLVVTEAENFDALTPQGGHTWMFSAASAGFSGPGYMEATPNEGVNRSDFPTEAADSPRLDYEVNFVKTGVHYLWVRGNAASGSDDSIHGGINGENPDTARRIDQSFTPNNSWVWAGGIEAGGPATIEVPSAGVHTVNMWMREDGFKFDKLVITSDPDFVPTDDLVDSRTGGGGGGRGEAGQFTGISLQGGNVVIEWSGGGTLQAADNVEGPYADVPGASSPESVAPSDPRKFYKLRD